MARHAATALVLVCIAACSSSEPTATSPATGTKADSPGELVYRWDSGATARRSYSLERAKVTKVNGAVDSEDRSGTVATVTATVLEATASGYSVAFRIDDAHTVPTIDMVDDMMRDMIGTSYVRSMSSRGEGAFASDAPSDLSGMLAVHMQLPILPSGETSVGTQWTGCLNRMRPNETGTVEITCEISELSEDAIAIAVAVREHREVEPPGWGTVESETKCDYRISLESPLPVSSSCDTKRVDTKRSGDSTTVVEMTIHRIIE